MRALLAAAALTAALAAPTAQAEVRFHGEVAGASVRMPVMSWRDIPFRSVVRQQFDYSCGSAAVATLLRFHYGVEVGEADVFRAMWEVGDQARIQEVGFSMLDMKAYLDARGYRADGLRAPLDLLARAGAPAIALITVGSYRHFVVIKGVRGDEVLLGDPSLGLRTMPRSEFEAIWNGVALVVRQPPQDAPTPTFNADDEWRPWATAPFDMAEQPRSPGLITRELPPLYQIRPPELDRVGAP